MWRASNEILRLHCKVNEIHFRLKLIYQIRLIQYLIFSNHKVVYYIKKLSPISKYDIDINLSLLKLIFISRQTILQQTSIGNQLYSVDNAHNTTLAG